MNYINITVRGKIARAEGRARVVCGNSDYTVRFDFDAEWAEYAVKTARFVSEDGSYTDAQFEGEDCAVPILRNTRTLLVGVFAGNLRTTTAALIHAVPCITDPDGTPSDPTSDVYTQLMERFNAMEAPAAILYEKQDLTAEQQATARENIGVATPDWEQNDEDQPDYIKNRPFYAESVYGIVGVGYNGWARVTKYAAVPITKMSVLGVIYKNVPVAAENDAVVEYVVGDHRLSFDRQYNTMTATPNNIGSNDVGFYGHLQTAVHKLPIEYIPNEVALTKNLPQSDWNEVNSSSASFIRNKPSPSDVTPSAPGTAAAGESTDYARADHVHPRELPECSDADAGKVLTVAGNADVQWQLPSAGADISLNMTGATAGQIAKITAVDDSGKPTAWEAVDMPSGGGGETWEKIAEIVIPDGAEETNALTINKDIDGNSFALIKARLCVKQPKYTGSSNIPSFCFAMINGKVTGRIAPLAYTNAFCVPSKSLVTGTVYEVDVSGAQQIETVYRPGNVGWSDDTSSDYIAYGGTGVNFGKHIGDTLWAKPITSIGGTSMLIYPGCRFVLYGVRA